MIEVGRGVFAPSSLIFYKYHVFHVQRPEDCKSSFVPLYVSAECKNFVLRFSWRISTSSLSPTDVRFRYRYNISLILFIGCDRHNCVAKSTFVDVVVFYFIPPLCLASNFH